ncbi:SusC/RagA family TonB-linked outer membrane protein [Zobellia amurskyensis]|nr:TonB-dependent receptor [Zobellia amurskyensis]
MRTFIFLLCSTVFGFTSSEIFSQNIKIQIEKNQILSVDEVFDLLRDQTDYSFIYPEDFFKDVPKVYVKKGPIQANELLERCFYGGGFKLDVRGKKIVITETDLANSEQQSIHVIGVVVDTSGQPLSGANIIEKGTTNGVTADFDGNYSINVIDRNAILVISYIGFATKEVAVEGKDEVNITLEESAATLDEIVVVGYGTQKKKDLTGSVSSIKTEDIQKTTSVSLDQAIQGRAAGVSVTSNTGSPGASPTVRIRGTGTVNNSDPLYVIDGVPINDILNFNMSDAESIDVLKDASATAIYGSRGANGVILIQTKKGSKRKPSISYSTYTGVQSRIDNLNILTSPQWAMLRNEANRNDDTPIDPELSNPESLKTYNWKDVAYRSGMIQDHQLSISGGSDKSTYYVSYGYLSQNGIVKESSYSRHNFRVNNTYQISNNIKVGHNIQYAYSKKNTGPEYGNNGSRVGFSGYVMEPTLPFYNEDGSYTAAEYSSTTNTLGRIEYETTPQVRENFFGNLFLEVDLVQGLKFRSNYGLEITNVQVDNFTPAFYVWSSFNSPVSTYDLVRSENRSMILSNTLNYNKVLNEKHNFGVLIGQEIQKLNGNDVRAQRSEIPTSVVNPTLGAGNVSTSTNDGGISQSQLQSYFGRLNYNYDERYLLTATYRFDGSSRFGENQRWGRFPSVALGWNVHNENFYNIPYINQLKFRAGWGQTGNQNLPNSATFNTLNLNTNYVYSADESTMVGVAPLRPGNPDLKWETTITKNIGADLGLWNNTLTLTADYFIKNTTDLLLAIPILSTSGYTGSPYGNAGNIENKGFELAANFRKNFDDFSFNIGGNISFVENKVIALATDGSLILTGQSQGFKDISRTEVGHPLASFYGYKMLGIFQTQEEVNNSAVISNTRPGDVKYADLNNDGIINDDDRTYIGSPFPDFTYGINLDMNYKEFDLSIFFQGSQGNDIFNATEYFVLGDLGTNHTTNSLNRWTGEGTSNSVPRVTFVNNGVNVQQSSRFVHDGSYIRLKNVQLGYSLPQELLDRTPISNLRIYLAGQNLITSTKYQGLNPELGIEGNDPLNIGIDRGRYPSARTLTLGLNVKF